MLSMKIKAADTDSNANQKVSSHDKFQSRLPDAVVILVLTYCEPDDLARISYQNRYYRIMARKAAEIILNKINVDYRCSFSSAPNLVRNLHEVIKRRIYIIGGEFRTSFFETCQEKKTLKCLSSLFFILYIYQIGGSLAEGPDSYLKTDHFDLYTKQWKPCHNMCMQRGSFKTELVSSMDKIVAVSGDQHSAAGTLEMYNPMKDQWTLLKQMPLSLVHMGATIVSSDLYVVGGLDIITKQLSTQIFRMTLELGNEQQEHFYFH